MPGCVKLCMTVWRRLIACNIEVHPNRVGPIVYTAYVCTYSIGMHPCTMQMCFLYVCLNAYVWWCILLHVRTCVPTCRQRRPILCMHACICVCMYFVCAFLYMHACIYAYCIVLYLSICIALFTAWALQKRSRPQQLTLCRSFHAEALQATVSEWIVQGS